MGIFFIFYFLKNYLFIFRERGKEKERGERNNQCVVASHAPHTGNLASTTQAYALTRNRTCDPLVCRPALNPLSHISQGYFLFV